MYESKNIYSGHDTTFGIVSIYFFQTENNFNIISSWDSTLLKIDYNVKSLLYLLYLKYIVIYFIYYRKIRPEKTQVNYELHLKNVTYN